MAKKSPVSRSCFMTDTLEYTVCIIKPDGMPYRKNILRSIIRHGFTILQRKRFQLSPEHAAEFYREYESHKSFMILVLNMSVGPVEIALLAREDAVDHFLGLIGPEKPSTARCMCPGSLRALYGNCTDDFKNAVHGSLSLEDAKKEINYFFPYFTHEIPRTEYLKLFCNISFRGPLMTGLQQLSKLRPSDTMPWMASWLLNNNPKRPAIEEMTLELCEQKKVADRLREREERSEIAESKKTSSTSVTDTTTSPSTGTTSTATTPDPVDNRKSAMVCSCSTTQSSGSEPKDKLEKALCCCNVQMKPGQIAVCPLCEKIIQYTVPVEKATTKPICEKKDPCSSTPSSFDSDGRDDLAISQKSSKDPCGRADPCLPCLSKSSTTTPYSISAKNSSTTESDQRCGVMDSFLKDVKDFKGQKQSNVG